MSDQGSDEQDQSATVNDRLDKDTSGPRPVDLLGLLMTPTVMAAVMAAVVITLIGKAKKVKPRRLFNIAPVNDDKAPYQ